MVKIKKETSLTSETGPDLVIVHLIHSYWKDERGFNLKISLKFLKRKSKGFNWVEEDINCLGSDWVLNKIINLHEVDDGVYQIVPISETRDWETGNIEDYDYQLVPY